MARSPEDTEPPDLGPRARRSALRRQQILDATAKTIAQHGYPKASLAQIAEEVGISAPSLLHHFRSKETLLTELLGYRDEVSLENALAQEPPHGHDFLRHLADTAALNTRRTGLTQLYAVLLGESVTEGHPAQDYFRNRFVGLRRMVRDAVWEAIGDERVSETAVLEVSGAIIAVMDGLQYQFLLDRDSVDMEAITARTVRALLRDLRPDGPRAAD